MAPIIKNGVHYKNLVYGKGAIPITKNIVVVDEQGNEYEATYPKRARGLVKSGRARFISEDKICLACPPNMNLEDKRMKIADMYKGTEAEGMAMQEIDISFIVRQVAMMQEEREYLHEALEKLSAMGDGDSGSAGAPGNLQGKAKANAFGDIVRCRETTNQQLLRFYERVYSDLVADK